MYYFFGERDSDFRARSFTFICVFINTHGCFHNPAGKCDVIYATPPYKQSGSINTTNALPPLFLKIYKTKS